MAETKDAKKCTCNMGALVGALIFFTLGLFVLVAGFARQFTVQLQQYSAMWIVVTLAIYFVGLVLMVVGKMFKWKSHGECPMHNKA